jgi:hypothetical protein
MSWLDVGLIALAGYLVGLVMGWTLSRGRVVDLEHRAAMQRRELANYAEWVKRLQGEAQLVGRTPASRDGRRPSPFTPGGH